MSDDLTLFDLPAPEPPDASRSDRGRAGYRYARSVAADVTVHRISVLLDAAVQAFDASPMIAIGEIDADEETPDSREQIGRDPTAALGWLLDPTDGIWPLLEAAAATVLEVDIDTSEVSPARHQVRWTVMIQLRDVAAFRRVALDTCPAEDTAARAEIAESLAAAWPRAAPPFAPLHRIPGISWSSPSSTGSAGPLSIWSSWPPSRTSVESTCSCSIRASTPRPRSPSSSASPGRPSTATSLACPPGARPLRHLPAEDGCRQFRCSSRANPPAPLIRRNNDAVGSHRR